MARSDLRKASDELAGLEEGGGSLQRQQLEAAVELAQETYITAKADVEELGSGPNALELNQLEAAAELAHGKLREARLVLAALQTPADPELINWWSEKVKQVETGAVGKDVPAALEIAKQVLDAIMSGADGEELRLIESEIALAQVTLMDIQQEELAILKTGLDPREIRAKESE